jgi:DNA repair protein RadA/Sms
MQPFVPGRADHASKRTATIYHCRACGEEQDWAQFCKKCNSFNTMVPGKCPAGGVQAFAPEKPQLLSEVKRDPHERIPTGTREFDRVLGGGLVMGSAVLISGDPGIGKSTLLLQTAIDLSLAEVTNKDTGAPEDPFVVLYVSAEETTSQIKGRAERLSKMSKRLYLYHQANVIEIDKRITEINPDVLIIDSIQTMVHPNAGDGGHAGSVTQVRACAEFIVNICKVRDIGCFIVAHINKEGVVAGPKTLEHLVDATLEFHKEGQGELRSVRASKNRFGDTNEMALFRMTKDGLQSIENPSELLLEHHRDGITGMCVGIAADGPRAMAVEVQAIVNSLDVEVKTQAKGKRFVTGLSSQRVNQVMAVLARRANVLIFTETYINIAGGVELRDPGLDLPLALSLVSFVLNVSLPESFCAFGEIGLGGEIRPVQYTDARIKAAALMGFETIVGPIVPEYEADLAETEEDDKKPEDGAEEDLDDEGEPDDGKERYLGVGTLEEVFEMLEFEIQKTQAKKSKKPTKKKKKKAAPKGESVPVAPPPETT